MSDETNCAAPVAVQKESHVTTRHGVLSDEYAWMKNANDPSVQRHLQLEHDYATAVMHHTDSLQAQLHQEMTRRVAFDSLTSPWSIGSYKYYSRMDSGGDYPVFCRKRTSSATVDGDASAVEEILLDLNDQSASVSLGLLLVSPDAKQLAFSLDSYGDERYKLYFKNLETGKVYDYHINDTAQYSVVWSADSQYVFYVVVDDISRPYSVCRHRLGSNPNEDVEVYRENDGSMIVTLHQTTSKRYLMLTGTNQSTAEVWYLDTHTPLEPFQRFAERSVGVEYWQVEHHGDYFYFLTNQNARNFALMRTPIHTLDPIHWEEVISTAETFKYEGMAAFASHLLLFVRDFTGRQQILAYSIEDKTLSTAPSPYPDEQCFHLWPGEVSDFVYEFPRRSHNMFQFNDTVLRFCFSTPVLPVSVYEYHFQSNQIVLLRDTVVPTYDATRYSCQRLLVPSSDGKHIPVSLVYSNHILSAPRTARPMYLDAYGAYGSCTELVFDSDLVCLLDRGVVCAYAHIRGDSDLGQEWYDQGKLLNKKRSFLDLLEVIDFLVVNSYTSNDLLCLVGRSAGGLPVGAVMNMRPGVARAAVLEVPFLDVVNDMTDERLPWVAFEWYEWGNPIESKEVFDFMKTYCPYANISTHVYPDVLCISALHDSRVPFYEPAKYVARLRRLRSNKNGLTLLQLLQGGHQGSAGRHGHLSDDVYKYAFVLDRLGAQSLKLQP
eukprot:GILK01013592.1.p1 GENE.GILK01013592.1~~GILK01013592.1.p1  ORF type:complete len:717 (-),score=74.08 GILK01013592.1:168-2318(-)